MKVKELFKDFRFSVISVLLFISASIAAISVLITGYFWYKTTLNYYHEDVKRLTNIYLTNAKDYSKYIVDNLIREIKEDINYTYSVTRKKEERSFFKVFQSVYMFKGVNRRSFLKTAEAILYKKTFESNISYYIFDFKGRCIFNPFDKGIEGKSVINIRDLKGRKPFLKIVNLAQTRDSGWLLQYWPYNWHFLSSKYVGRDGFTFFGVLRNYGYIVVGRFDLAPVEYALKQKWIRYLSIYRYGKENHGYIFVLRINRNHPNNKKCFTYEIVNPNTPKELGRCLSLFKKDKEGFMYREKYFSDIKKKGYSFVEYYYKLPGTNKKVLKISYLKLFKRWDWIIGTGTYMPDLYNSLHLSEIESKRDLDRIKSTLAVLVIFMLSAIGFLYSLVSKFTDRKINSIFKNFEDSFERSEPIDASPYKKIKQLSWVINSLNRAIAKFKKYENELLRSFVDVLETRDIYTKGHSQRVAFYAKKIAETLGFDKGFQDRIYKAGLLHDIGKVGIPDNILLKPGKLSENEYKTIKYHSIISYEILKRIEHFEDIADCVRQHHEKCDGSGYPDGLKCRQITIGARILAIADIFDALTTTRPYRRAFPPEKAIEILEKEKVDQEILRKVKNVLLEVSKDRDLTVIEFMSEEIDKIRGEIFKIDYMTGLLFITSFVGELRKLIKKEKKFVLFCVDIKGISKINYKFSTEVGNSVIEETAKVIKHQAENFKDREVFSCRAYADVFLIAVEIKSDFENIKSKYSSELLTGLLKDVFIKNEDCLEKDKEGVCITEYLSLKVASVVYPEDGQAAEELIYLVERKTKSIG